MAFGGALAAVFYINRLRAARRNGYSYSYTREGTRVRTVKGTIAFKTDLVFFYIWIFIYAVGSLIIMICVIIDIWHSN